ncbi:MAG TPA: 2-oxoacid:acceptor oxidoreductase family protein [Methylomirabilota bacterium]|nr:2-oxoacid:acceptor oxidoreductase family protein [Methylomirabilota bacterium]
MIRIRFHGRGGQGMKTASRVVGTAALLDGFIAQDSPVYGAERRGAPMTAHTRIARETILERGLIANPDLVVVADDTLLDDPSVEPLTGTSSEGVLLLSSAHSPDELREHTGYQGVIEARDLLALALEHVGSAAGVSTALAAAACKLLGLSDGSTEEALKKELPQIGLDPQVVKASLRLAERARVGFEPIEISPPTRSGRPPRSTVVDVT